MAPTPPTDTGTHRRTEPIPEGWPGNDPTLRDEVAALRGRRRRSPAPPEAHAGDEADLDRPGGGEDRHDHDDDVADPSAGRGRPDRRHEDAHGDQERLRHEDDGGDDGGDRDDAYDDLVAGAQPAGRVLVVMVVALLLAMLVNADALVERAENRPPGAQRDRALAIWHPVQDVSHVLQLHRLRDLAEWAAGGDGEAPPAPAPGRGSRARAAADSEPAPPGEAAPGGDRDDAPADGELRTPTADEPLRVVVAGDFMVQALGEALVGGSEERGLLDTLVHYESASGLTRSDYYDWPEALARDVDEHDAEVLVVMFGANDGQGITLADRTPVPTVDDPRWLPEYRRRVASLMDQLRAPGRAVVWVTQPPMRNPSFAAAVRTINEAFIEEAADRPWVTVVEPGDLIGAEGGVYAENVPAAGGGDPVVVRQPDGIHLTPAGGDLLATRVLAVIGEAAGVDVAD
jgi:hypothetical protein